MYSYIHIWNVFSSFDPSLVITEQRSAVKTGEQLGVQCLPHELCGERGFNRGPCGYGPTPRAIADMWIRPWTYGRCRNRACSAHYYPTNHNTWKLLLSASADTLKHMETHPRGTLGNELENCIDNVDGHLPPWCECVWLKKSVCVRRPQCWGCSPGQLNCLFLTEAVWISRP